MNQQSYTPEQWLMMAAAEKRAAELLLGERTLQRVVFGHIGFGVEYTLKAALQHKFRYNTWPASLRTHDLPVLMAALGVNVCPQHPIAAAWATVSQWRRSELYNPDEFSLAVVRGLFDAAFSEEGVEPWIRQNFLATF
ncbi:hypothetical protein [Shinella sp. BYT-45]|uniref:hypothetical protein n=1 Tax=Shinella sp. BYT-45 TaxID=3377377 RepID=UPI00397F45C6